MARALCCFLVALLLLAADAPAQQNPNKKFEVYPVGLADFDFVVETVKGMLSSDGKMIPDADQRRIIVVDKPEVHEQIAKLLKILQVPQKNVRIRVRFDEYSSGQRLGLGAGGTVKSGDVTFTTTGDPKPGIHVNAIDQTSGMNSTLQQELLVINNGTASLDVTTEVPYYEWIYNYGLDKGFWPASVASWRSVGARLRIKPSIQGNVIRIKLTPELSRFVDGQPDVIALEKLSTEVLAADGQDVSLGGLPADVQEFYSKFLVGYDSDRRARSLNITLTPTIEEPFVPPQ